MTQFVYATSGASHRWLAIALLCFFGLAGVGLSAAWLPAGQGDYAYAGAQYHAIARHHLQLGLTQTRLAQFRVFHDIPQSELTDADGTFRGAALRESYGDRFWTSRLPFGALLYTASVGIFGDHEWAVRLVPYLATGFLVLILYGLLGGLFGRGVALASAALFALIPATIANAQLAGYEMPCLLFVTLTFLMYERYRVGRAPFWLVTLLATAAGLLGWFGLYVIPILLFDSLRPCAKRNVTRSERLLWLLIPVAVGGLYIVYMHGLGQSVAERVEYYWAKRGFAGLTATDTAATDFAAASTMSAWEYLYRVQKFFVNHVTPLPLALSAAWVIAYMCARHYGTRYCEGRLALMFAAFATMCYVITLRASYEHRYYVLWWLPVLALTGGSFLARLWRGTLLEVASEAVEDDAPRRVPTWRKILVGMAIVGVLISSAYKVNRYQEKTKPAAALNQFMAKVGQLKTMPKNGRVFIVDRNELFVAGYNEQGEKLFATGSFTTEMGYDDKHPHLFYLWRPLATTCLVYLGSLRAGGALFSRAPLYTIILPDPNPTFLRPMLPRAIPGYNVEIFKSTSEGLTFDSPAGVVHRKKIVEDDTRTVWRVWTVSAP